MNEHIMDYIKLQWEDIHHSRQQEWQALGVIAGNFLIVATVQSSEAKFFFGLLGILSSFIGACISWQHHIIFLDKVSVITKLEHQLGIQYPRRYTLLPVQVLLFLIFGGITSVFIGTTLVYLLQTLKLDFLQTWAYLAMLGSFGLFLGFASYQSLKARRVKSYGFTHPFYAEMEELDRCLASLGSVPLKLVVGERFSRPGIEEVAWERPKWTWHRDSNLITKQVLLNQRDVFQFSLASAASTQSWHYHKSTFEIYVSNHRMDLEYEDQGPERKKQALCIDRGLLIVPPGVPHRVNLSGNTFVFQSTLADGNLGNDKEGEK